MTLPTKEEFEAFKKSRDYQVSADEAYLWICEYANKEKLFVGEFTTEDPTIQHHSSKEGYERVNHWINAPKEDDKT